VTERHYGIQAIRGFASALQGLLDQVADIRVEGDVACTDGKTIILPATQVHDERGFRWLCANACHESAHVWFDSVEKMKPAVGDPPCPRRKDCANWVLDVADETRFEHAFSGARQLFALADEDDGRKWLDDLPDQCPDDARDLGERGFLGVAYTLGRRSKPSAEIRRRLRGWRRRLPELDEACRILIRARTRRPRGRFRPSRSRRQWERLHDLARQLAALVENMFGPLPPQEQQPAPGAGGTTGDAGTPTPVRGLAPRQQAEADNSANRPPGGMPADLLALLAPLSGHLTADWQEVLGAAADRLPPVPVQRSTKTRAQRLRDRLFPSSQSIAFPEDSFVRLRAAFRKSVRHLRRGPSLVREYGFSRGSHLGRLERVATDGRCFSRIHFEEEDGDTTVAVLLDTSASMACVLGAYAAAAAALCQALQEAGFGCAAWTFSSQAHRVEIGSLRHVRAGGMTSTADAMHEARLWLETRADQRQAMVILTDGQPTDPHAAQDEMRRVHARGIDLLIGAIGDNTREICERLFTRAVVFDCSAQWGGPSLLAAVRRLARKDAAG
jgi:hypothetical protein